MSTIAKKSIVRGIVTLVITSALFAGDLAGQRIAVRRDALDPALRRAFDAGHLRELRRETSTTPSVDADRTTLRIDPRAMLIARDETVGSARLDGELLLPFHIGVVTDPPGAAEPVVLDLRPKVASSGAFVPANGAFRAELIVSLVATDSGADVALPSPVELTVVVEGGEAKPNVLKFESLGQAQTVSLTIPTARDDVTVTVDLSRLDATPFQLVLSTRRGKLTLSATPKEILGYGLGTATILIEADELVPANSAIGLEADSGTLDPLRPTLDDQRGATATLRSDGLGACIVRAPRWDEPPGSASTTIVFTPPIVFFVFALLGGVLGSALRVFRLRKQRAWGRAIAVGTLAGLLGAILWALGLRVLTLDFTPATSEFAAFGISALVGLGFGTFWQPFAKPAR
ncbi:MAG: hypothetical protein HZB39_01525 [Planctomycetes bacterium]|nr:hypothetical protein [Planctomycetota bacterium]